MSIKVAYIALGSNLGDREAHLSAAHAALSAMSRSRILAASRIEETEPLGDVPQGPYLNQMIALETSLSPRELLSALQEIERSRGRVREERWGPRTLDLDIVQWGGRTHDEPGLTIPHPQIGARDFWRRELDELHAILGARA